MTKAESELHWKEMFDRAAAEDKVINTRSLAVKEKQNSSESTMFEELTAFFEVSLLKRTGGSLEKRSSSVFVSLMCMSLRGYKVLLVAI